VPLGYQVEGIKTHLTTVVALGTTQTQEIENDSRKTLVILGKKVAEKRELGLQMVCLGTLIQKLENANYPLLPWDSPG
jgi:predicted YcjX-like family ATPase